MSKKKPNVSNGFCANAKCRAPFVPQQCHQVYCRPKCSMAANFARHYAAHPEKYREITKRNRERKRSYDRERLTGWSQEEYDKAFLVQKGRCAICGLHQSELRKALAGDHNHITDKKRGLLCGVCNTAIGLLGDSSVRVDKASAYLKEYE